MPLKLSAFFKQCPRLHSDMRITI